MILRECFIVVAVNGEIEKLGVGVEVSGGD